MVARQGLASTLAALGKTQEALSLLPEGYPNSLDDWVGWHIRGMIMLRYGDDKSLREAIDIFERGAKENPFASSRDYFISALAVARLRMGEAESALSLLDTVKSHDMRTPAQVLKVHAFGMKGDVDGATREFKLLPGNPEPIRKEVQDELKTRYVKEMPPPNDDDWLFQREIVYLLAA
jgi:predicted negative regulator of RcsB-dependent stress response